MSKMFWILWKAQEWAFSVETNKQEWQNSSTSNGHKYERLFYEEGDMFRVYTCWKHAAYHWIDRERERMENRAQINFSPVQIPFCIHFNGSLQRTFPWLNVSQCVHAYKWWMQLNEIYAFAHNLLRTKIVYDNIIALVYSLKGSYLVFFLPRYVVPVDGVYCSTAWNICTFFHHRIRLELRLPSTLPSSSSFYIFSMFVMATFFSFVLFFPRYFSV